jgi:hypothetical protein
MVMEREKVLIMTGRRESMLVVAACPDVHRNVHAGPISLCSRLICSPKRALLLSVGDAYFWLCVFIGVDT